MNNKNVLQMISGALMFIGFFSIWYDQDGFNYLKPAELIGWNNANLPFVFKLFWLLPLLGIVNIYYGFINKYHYILCIVSSVFCFLLIWETWGWVDKVRASAPSASVASGFYMVSFALLVSAASIFVMKKEIKSESINSEG